MKMDEDGTYRMLSLLRIRYGKNKTLEDILKEESYESTVL